MNSRLEVWTSRLSDMLRLLEKDGPVTASDLPKVIQDALMNLASLEEIRDLQAHLIAALENAGVMLDGGEEPLDFDLDSQAFDWKAWKEGTEDLAKVSEEELWAHLGFGEKKQLPLFQEWYDPSGMIEPWSEEGVAWLENPQSGRARLQPKWHQLVGIFRMLQHLFEGRAVLLMDGVGLGKTLQSVGVLACLVYYREHYRQKNDYPGWFKGRRFQSHLSGMIPDLPSIIVCPPNLQAQWTREMHAFLRRRSFDILPLVGKHASRRNWDDAVFEKSKQAPTMKVVLTGTQVLADDGKMLFEAVEKRGEANPSVAFSRYRKGTAYGQDYLLLILDEAHAARKPNQLHVAVRGLRDRVSAMVAMTATPVTTKPE
ncbi:hypothetical protein GLOTRDRAFT_134692, partial [Gloeophyllum trabeum ATCC 11539]